MTSDFHHYHFFHSLEVSEVLASSKIKNFLIMRNPFDVLVSACYYIDKMPYDSGFLRSMGLTYSEWIAKDFSQKLSKIIEDFRLKEQFELCLSAEHQENCCLVTFEELVGSHGGGDDKIQFETVKKIAQFLNLTLTKERILNLCGLLFGGTHTFNTGSIGKYKSHFEQKHYEAVRKIMGDELLKTVLEKTTL